MSKGWKYEPERHALAARGIKTGQKGRPRPRPSKKDPFTYQDTNQERIIHTDWDEGNSYKFVLEGAGDIFRELTLSEPSEVYVFEKIRRIERHFEMKEKQRVHFPDTGIHPEDSWENAYDNNRDDFEKMLLQWADQPINNEIQEVAVMLNIAMLQGEHQKAQQKIDIIKDYFEKQQ